MKNTLKAVIPAEAEITNECGILIFY